MTINLITVSAVSRAQDKTVETVAEIKYATIAPSRVHAASPQGY